jgi:hypothetical protein
MMELHIWGRELAPNPAPPIVRRTKGEHCRIARHGRRPDKREAEMLSEENLKELRHNLAHLSLPTVRDFYEQAYRDCRLVYNNLPSPRQIQTLVQVWKQLWKWR